MRSSPKIWMNTTTSFNWSRPVVGIVRTEVEIKKHLKQNYGNDFQECIWDGQRFILKPDIAEVYSVKRTHNSKKQPINWLFPIVPKIEALKLFAQSVLSLAPRFIRPILNKIFIKSKAPVLRAIYWGMRMKQKKMQHPEKVNSDYSCLFNKGDVLISIGLDWDNGCYQEFYQLKQKGVKIITCCYDLIPVLYPQYCVANVANKFMSYFMDIADGSNLILCISQRTQKDLKEMLYATGGADVETKVIRLGDSILKKEEGIKLDFNIEQLLAQRFVLYVSTIERRKNHETLYKAYHSILSQDPNADLPILVFVGMAGWGVNDLLSDIELDPVTRRHIKILKTVTDTELSFLYEAALFCVFPSLYEGWGLPVSEALSYGKVVISSDRGSLPEVGGDFVEYVDPWDVKSWADMIVKLSSDSELRKSIENKVRQNYRSYGWDHTVKDISKYIDRIIKDK